MQLALADIWAMGGICMGGALKATATALRELAVNARHLGSKGAEMSDLILDRL